MPLALDEVLRDHWPGFARRYETRLAAAHHRAARAVMSCRTPALGGHVWQCPCHHHHSHYSYHSCNHRSCPQCGSLDQHVIVSNAFAQAGGDAARARLVSLGRYAMKGVARPQELFTLDPG